MSETLIGKFVNNNFSFPGGFAIQADKPIDDRLVVHSVASLTAANTFVSSTDNCQKAYNGMVVSVLDTNEIYILKDVANITNINSWEKLNVPHASSADAGKLLTVVQDTNGNYVAQWDEAPNGLPEIGTGNTDAGKVLTVSSNGIAEWKPIEHPDQLPTSSSTDNGKVLTVNSSGNPAWSRLNLMTSISTSSLKSAASAGTLIPGMKYRITDYCPTPFEDTITINGKSYMIGVDSDSIKFDIIATASSNKTLFEDVELISKTPNATFDYSKYKAKYDLLGNSEEDKYEYIASEAYGVIYYMKDQFGNEASYDFENLYYIDEENNDIHRYTFTSIANNSVSDLRETSCVQNVRIKHSYIYSLPCVMFLLNKTDSRNVNIYDVEIDNCEDIYICDSNLSNSKISNSYRVSIDITMGEDNVRYPSFNNLNIYGNDDLRIYCDEPVDFIREFESYGISINNINILPSLRTRELNISDLYNLTYEIISQGLIDSNIVDTLDNSQCRWIKDLIQTDNTTANTTARINIFTSNTPVTFGAYDSLVHESIYNASKIIKPFDIFNAKDDAGNAKLWSLEIPQFHSTATSVVELGI